MIIEYPCEGLTKIIAEKNKKITNKQRSLFTDFLFFGINDSVDNYDEVGYEIWKHFIEEEDDPTIDELKSRLNSIQDDIAGIKDNNMRIEEYILDTNYAILDMQIKLDMI